MRAKPTPTPTRGPKSKMIPRRRFGHLVILSRARDRRGNPYFRCRCACGRVIVLSRSALCGQKQRTCGWRCPVRQAESFWAKVKKGVGPKQCWVWQGSRCRGGYAQIERDGKRILVHRYAYILTHGAVPDGLDVLHKCDNPPCVRPRHLFAGTHQDNMDDMVAKGRSRRHKVRT